MLPLLVPPPPRRRLVLGFATLHSLGFAGKGCVLPRWDLMYATAPCLRLRVLGCLGVRVLIAPSRGLASVVICMAGASS